MNLIRFLHICSPLPLFHFKPDLLLIGFLHLPILKQSLVSSETSVRRSNQAWHIRVQESTANQLGQVVQQYRHLRVEVLTVRILDGRWHTPDYLLLPGVYVFDLNLTLPTSGDLEFLTALGVFDLPTNTGGSGPLFGNELDLNAVTS